MFTKIMTRLEELERRAANTVRMGKVAEVDPAKGLVKLKTGNLTSDWVPWTTQAGDFNVWIPPSVGQQMMLVSPSGEPGQGWAAPGGFSNDTSQPHNKGGEGVITRGATKITITGDSAIVETQTATIKASTVNLGGEGGPAVARIGDVTDDGAKIISGSGTVFAID